MEREREGGGKWGEREAVREREREGGRGEGRERKGGRGNENITDK